MLQSRHKPISVGNDPTSSMRLTTPALPAQSCIFYDYRKQFIINNSGSDLTDYQVMFTVYRSTGTDSGTTVYVGTKCESDYDDIRFTDSSGTVLSYWIESSTSSSATIWVKFPSIPAGSSTWYLYYGNASATAVSNGDATFQLFDDFIGSSVDTSKWTVTGSPAVSGGELTVTTGTVVVSKIDFGVNYIVKVRFKSSAYSADSFPHFGFRNSGDGAFTWATPDGIFCIYTRVGGSATRVGLSSNPSINTYYTAEIARRSTSSVLFSVSGFSSVQSTTNIPSASVSITLSTAGSSSPTVTYDFVFVRKYTATEPTVSAWSAEQVV